MYKIMNDYTPAQYFLSIISYQVAGATERFLLFDSNNDTTGAIPKKITKKKKKKKLAIEVLTIIVKYWEIIQKQ